MCRPFQEHGTCKYGDKCQFAHGNNEVRNVNRHPKYKTDLCRTYHSVGFCPYGPRCHFIHALEEMQKSPERVPDKKVTGPIKQLPMYGGPTAPGTDSTWSPHGPQQDDMAGAVRSLNKYFNMSAGGRDGLSSSADTSRSGSFCSDVDSSSLPSSSPPPSDDPRNSSIRLPIFNRLA
jgi:hypothetical protein